MIRDAKPIDALREVALIEFARRGCVSEPIDGRAATIGFKCSLQEQASQFHDVAVAHESTSIEQPPRLREGNLGTLYLAYVRDPDANKLCVLYSPKTER